MWSFAVAVLDTFSRRLFVFAAVLYRGSRRHPRLVAAATLVALTLSVAGASRLELALTINDMIDQSFASAQQQRRAQALFDGGQTVLVRFARKTGEALTRDDLCRIHLWSAKRSMEHSIAGVASPFLTPRARFEGGALWYPPLSPSPCSGDVMQTTDILRPAANSLFGPVLTSPQGGDVAAMVSFHATTLAQTEPAYSNMLSTLAATFPAEDPVAFELTGAAAYQWHSRRALASDLRLNLLFLVVTLVLFRALFGTWRGGFLLIGSLAVTATIIYGFMGWLGLPLGLMANALFVLVSLAGMQDFLYVTNLRAGSENGSWSHGFARQLVPAFWTSVTTMVGFGSLAVSDLPPIRQFGMCAAFGVFVEWLVVFFVMPALLTLLPSLRRWTNLKKALLPTDALERMMERGSPARWAPAMIAVMVASAAVVPRLSVNDSMLDTFASSHPLTVAERHLAASRGWSLSLDVIVPGKVPEARQREVMRELAALPGVVHVLDGFAIERELVTAVPADVGDSVQRTWRYSEARRQFVAKNGAARAIVLVREADVRAITALLASIEQTCGRDGCFAVGDVVSFAEFNARVQKDFYEGLAVSLVLVIGCLFLLARRQSPREIVALVVGSVWGPVVALGGYALVIGDMNFCSTAVVAILVGLAGDNAIQFIFVRRTPGLVQSVEQRGSGVVQIAIQMGVTALLMAGSSFVQTRHLGPTLAASFALLAVGDVWVVKALLQRLAFEERA